MTPEKYRKIKDILLNVLQTSKDKQAQKLDELCGSQAAIKSAVEKLLRINDSEQSSLMEIPAIINQLPQLDSIPKEKPQPKFIKQYEVIEKIGSGGMGDVYLAIQSYPAERQVAIKVLKQLPNQQRLFEETQILARLNHPNIATLHEVDKTENDELFIVMELIQGDDIIKWCEDHNYGLNQKIYLFQQLCSGISYAHEKGIIHCDIKPCNIQVTEINNQAVVKIIDFGISQYEKHQNETKGIAGTPAYLAPEFLNRKYKGISDTRRDVYALGVLLNKLLPNDVSKDLTAIIKKSTNSQKIQRYATVTNLNSDLQRFLEKRIVKARERTTGYVISRYVQRNIGIVSFALILILSLVGGFIAQSIQANKAKLQAQIAIEHRKVAEVAQSEAEELTVFLVDLFNLSNPERTNNKEITASDLINKANDKLLAIESPTLADARFMHTIGSIFTRMDKLEKSKIIVEKSLRIKQQNLIHNHDEIISGTTQLGLIYRRLNNNDLAEKYLNRSLDLLKTQGQPNLSQLAFTHNHLGNLYWQIYNPQQSIFHHEQAIVLRKKTGEDNLLADSYNNLGAIYNKNKQWNLSRKHINQALNLYRKSYDEDHPYIAFAMNNLAQIEEHRFNWEKAESLFIKTLEKLIKIYGKSHQNTLIAQINLAIFYHRRMQYTQSIKLRETVINIHKENGNTEKAAIQIDVLARLYADLGDFDHSKAYHLEAMALIKNIQTKNPNLIQMFQCEYSYTLMKFNNYSLAILLLKQSIAQLDEKNDPSNYKTFYARNLLAHAYYKQNEFDKAQKLFQHVLLYNDESRVLAQVEHVKAHLGLGKIFAANKQLDKAIDKFNTALEINQKHNGIIHYRNAEILYEIGKVHLQNNNKDFAKKYFQQAFDMQKTVLPEEHKDLKKSRTALSKL